MGNFLKVVQKRNITFVEKRLVVDRTLSFWDTDKRSKTPTFVNIVLFIFYFIIIIFVINFYLSYDACIVLCIMYMRYANPTYMVANQLICILYLTSLTFNKTDKIIMDSEVLFRRLLAVSQQRYVNLEHVLSHELAPVSPSLFNDEGTMRKTTKADLESNWYEIQVLAVCHDKHTAHIHNRWDGPTSGV